ncbi:MAG: type II secretion system F family protein [Phycisphaerae bacterium]|jgi:general secretion pathway protein F/type IV pilus assembly protein PilC|nr:type II secretion system F family protein [Phycisphaerae bacterium]
MQADCESAVVHALGERSLYPVKVAQQTKPGRIGARSGAKVRRRDVGVMYGQLADLLRAGVPMLRALEIIARSGMRGRIAEIILELRQDVAAGRTLTEAMASHENTFPPLHSAMVNAGEHAGFLEDVLTDLANFVERQDELRNKVRGAMIYPILLSVVGVAVVSLMLVLVVPELKKVFQDASNLPVLTRVVFAASDLLVENTLLVVCMVVLGVTGIVAGLKSPAGHRLWERSKLKIPIVGKTICVVAITRFCRILGTMIANGVPILRALDIAKDATGSEVLGKSIEEAADAVREGKPLAEPLRASGLVPIEIVEMIAVAEESNQLDRVLVQVADTVERRTNRQVDTAVRLIEPIILVLMAVMVGAIALALLFPIFTMASQFQ